MILLLMASGQEIKRIIDFFTGRNEVSALYLFGSSATKRETPDSDIDIAVLIDDNVAREARYALLRKKFYAASPTFSLRPVDIVILNTAPPYLKHRILKTGKILFARDERLRARFAARSIIEYLDYKPVEDICLKAVAGRVGR